MSRIFRINTLKNIKTDIPIPTDVLRDIAYFLNHRKSVGSYRSNEAISLDSGTGLDCISAFYLMYYVRIEVPTRHPNIVNLLYACAYAVDIKIETAVDDCLEGVHVPEQIESWWKNDKVSKDMPDWVLNQFWERYHEKTPI